MTVHLWDTAGQERFQALSPSFYRAADLCLLVFDLTHRASFLALNYWYGRIAPRRSAFIPGRPLFFRLDQFLVYGDPPDLANFPLAVIGNRADEVSAREVFPVAPVRLSRRE